MPADFDDVGERLEHLRGETEQVDWAGADTVRDRGRQRARRKTVTGTLAVCLGIGALGLSVTNNLPGQQAFLNSQIPFASTPNGLQSSARGPETGEYHRSPDGSPSKNNGGHDPGDTKEPGKNGNTPPPGSPLPSGSATPTTTPTTGPTDIPTPGPTATPTNTPNPEPTQTPTQTPTPTIDAEALVVASEMPIVNDSGDGWEGSDTGSEGDRRSICQQDSIENLGASDTVGRNFTWGADSKITGFTVAAVFPSAGDSEKAYNDFDEWIGACTDVGDPVEISVEGGQARWWLYKKSTSETTGEFEAIGLVQRGNGLATVIVHNADALDWTYEQDPMKPSLESAATRLP